MQLLSFFQTPSEDNFFSSFLLFFCRTIVIIMIMRVKCTYDFTLMISVLLFVSVPDQAPVIAEIYPVSSKECIISWVPIPPEHHRGVLLGYRIVFVANGSVDNTNITVDTTTTRKVPVGDLRSYTYYLIKVAGFTSGGDGNYSDLAGCLTNEDGEDFLLVKLHCINFFFHGYSPSSCEISNDNEFVQLKFHIWNSTYLGTNVNNCTFSVHIYFFQRSVGCTTCKLNIISYRSFLVYAPFHRKLKSLFYIVVCKTIILENLKLSEYVQRR